MLGVKGDAFRERLLSKIKPAKLYGVFRKVCVDPRCVLMQAMLQRNSKAILQHGLSLCPPPEDQGRADIVERMRAYIGVRKLRFNR